MTVKRRVTYRPDLNAPFSLKDLLKPVSLFQKGDLFPLIDVKWDVITDSDPIEDLKRWRKQVEELKGHYYHDLMFWEYSWEDRGFGLWQMHIPRASGKTAFYDMTRHIMFLGDRTAFAQVGPNLRKLKLKINKKVLKKEKNKKLRPQRDEWRRQERLRNKRLPGR
jgi:hypothetical protein